MLDYDTDSTLRTQLLELPDLLHWADTMLLPGSTPSTGRVSGGNTDAPLPLNQHIADLIIPAERTIASWARAVRYELQRANDWSGWQTWRHTAPNPVLAHLEFLTWHHQFAVTRVLAPDYAAEIDTVHRDLVRATGAILRRPVRIPCPRCQMLTMQERADGRRECCNPDCVAVVTPSEYAHRAEQLLTELAAVA